jgi:hypothetical protein
MQEFGEIEGTVALRGGFSLIYTHNIVQRWLEIHRLANLFGWVHLQEAQLMIGSDANVMNDFTCVFSSITFGIFALHSHYLPEPDALSSPPTELLSNIARRVQVSHASAAN